MLRKEGSPVKTPEVEITKRIKNLQTKIEDSLLKSPEYLLKAGKRNLKREMDIQGFIINRQGKHIWMDCSVVEGEYFLLKYAVNTQPEQHFTITEMLGKQCSLNFSGKDEKTGESLHLNTLILEQVEPALQKLSDFYNLLSS